MTNYVLYDTIFWCLSPANLARVSSICRNANIAVKDYLSRVCNINKLLARYFPDPRAFRSLQATTNTLIAGSTALQFFDRSVYPESDLDLYVPLYFAKYVGTWLINNGYTFTPNMIQEGDFNVAAETDRMTESYGSIRGVATVFTFVKAGAAESTESQVKIQLIVALRSPFEVILWFHSTCVMNVITFSKAYCLYPRATLEARRALVCRRLNMAGQTAIKKYEDRGWDMTFISEVNDPEWLFYQGPRWVGDDFTYTISLDMNGVEYPAPLTYRSAPIVKDPVVVQSWELIVDRYYPRRAKMRFTVHQSPFLFYRYCSIFPQSFELAEPIFEKYQRVWSQQEPPHLFEEEQFVDTEWIDFCEAFLAMQRVLLKRPCIPY
ncbi:hypothetical protein C8Q75DRAFT_504164 [Abortiporus biennis]|nr:hypothetical protein C8Q75DRAFT_504164 [Abortiporus biennis]